jgi:hypothetical protein
MADDAIDQFVALPKEERGKLFEQLAPDKQQSLLTKIRERKSRVGVNVPTLPRGEISNPAAGGPMNWLNQVQQDVKKGTGATIIGRGLQYLGARGTDMGVPEAVGDIMPGGGTIQGVAKMAHGTGKVAQGHPIQGGNEILRGFGQATAPAIAATNPEFLPSAVAYGAAGAGIEKVSNEVGFDPETSEFIGNVVTGFLGGKKAMKQSEKTRTGKLAYASGGKDSVRPLERVIGDIDKTVAKVGKPRTVGDFLQVVDTAKGDLNTEYANALGPHANDPVAAHPIADRIRSLITPNMQNTEHGREMAGQIKNAAVEFDKPWTLGELDAERMDANSRTHAYEKKNMSDQYAALKGRRSVAIDKAIADGVREMVYPIMDRTAGKPKGYFADLKGRIGSLLELQSNLNEHVKDIHSKSVTASGAPFFERSQFRANVGQSGSPRVWLSNLMSSIHAPDPESRAGGVLRGAFKTPSAVPLVMSMPVKVLLTGDYTTDKKDRRLPASHPVAQSNPVQ